METPTSSWMRRRSTPGLITLGVLFVCVVAVVAGVMSWGHIQEVGHRYGEPGANLLPVSVDGMMLAGTVMGAVDHIRGYKTRFWAIVSLWLGSIMTMGFNMVSAVERGPIAMGLATIPAIALIVSVESIFHPSRRLLETTKQALVQVAENVKNIVESAPVAPPVAKPEAQPVPAKKATPPQGVRGRKHGPQGKPNRPNMQPQRMQAPGTPPRQTRPAVVEAVMHEETPEPVAGHTVDISAN